MQSILEYLKDTNMHDMLLDIHLPISIEDLLSLNMSADKLTELIIASFGADSNDDWPNPVQRVFILVSLYRTFENLRVQNYTSLKTALAKRKTLSGRPLNVIGTRCELASRTAQALFFLGRNSPSIPQCLKMLECSHDLLVILLTKCRQKDNPKHAMQFHGIMGVCRLMLTVQMSSKLSHERQYSLFGHALKSLEESFRLGNKGASAVTYLLDTLMHLFEIDQSDETLSKVWFTIESLSNSERNNRGVLFYLGKYYFSKSFIETDKLDYLNKALEVLNQSIALPQIMSIDDEIIRQVRGQVYIRYAMLFGDNKQDTKSLKYLSKGISDLKFSFENSPDKYGKQVSLTSGLHSRSKINLKLKKYSEAREDLQYILNQPELRNGDLSVIAIVEIDLVLVDLVEALENEDTGLIKELLPRVVGHPQCINQGSLFIGLAAKKLFANATFSDDPNLLIEVIELLWLIDLETHSDPTTQQMHFSVLGALQNIYSMWDYRSLERAIESYIYALKLPITQPPELLAAYGESSLQLAKYFINDEKKINRCSELLEEAANAFTKAAHIVESDSKAASESFKLVVTYSKAGEAQLRLCMLTGSEVYARMAINNFLKARELGNNTPEIHGLIGDCYYQIYKITRSKNLLEDVLYYKNLAREAGGDSRENFSLSARIYLLMWEKSANIEHLVNSIRWAAKAHELSPNWPWPPFQLVEIANQAGQASFNLALSTIKNNGTSLRLLDIALNNSLDLLIEMGCKLVISDKEFGKKILGGRQKVYVMDDPHRLLSESYVFKNTFPQNAARDKEIILEFRKFLSEKKINGLRLPEPVVILPHEKSRVIYVMKRSKGFHLGRSVINANKEGTELPLEEFKKALKYLAAYHAWGIKRSGELKGNLAIFLQEYLKSLSIDPKVLPKDCEHLIKELWQFPMFIKKDAHPENWMIDSFGNICMIDFESSKPLPALFELVQLIEDYPLLIANQANWIIRCRLCRHYIESFERYSGSSISINNQVMEKLYAIFAMLRCGFGLQYCYRKNKTYSSSSALRSREERINHYQNLLNWFAEKYTEKGIGSLANAIFDKNRK